MTTSVTFNGVAYSVPAIADASWGTNVTNYLIAISTGCLQKTGGTFTLTAEVNFGATYGLKAAYLKTQTSNIAAAGAVRLAQADTINWRNAANAADLALAVVSDVLKFGGVTLATAGVGSIVNADISASAAIAYSKLALTGAILNADLAGSIAYSKLSLAGAILNADLAGSIAYSKLSLTGAIQNADLVGPVSVAKGGTGSASVVTAPTASAWAGWDANSNLSSNNHIEGYATTATAAGTTTLTVGSAFQQFFTGVTTQTVKLPVASTLVLGYQLQVVNNSSGVVTVQSSGSNTVQAMAASSSAVFTCILTSGATAASWAVVYGLQNAGAGTVTSVGMTVPSFLSVSGSPVTSTGTLAITLSGTQLPGANVAVVVPGTTAGVVSANGLTGATTVSSIGTGFVGEILTFTSRVISAGTSNYTSNASALTTLTPGIWAVYGYMNVAATASLTSIQGFISTNTTNDSSGGLGDGTITYAATGGTVAVHAPLITFFNGSSSSVPIYAKAETTGASASITFGGYAVRIA